MELYEIIITVNGQTHTVRFMADSQQTALTKARIHAAWNITGYKENEARFDVRQLRQDVLMQSLGATLLPGLEV